MFLVFIFLKVKVASSIQNQQRPDIKSWLMAAWGVIVTCRWISEVKKSKKFHHTFAVAHNLAADKHIHKKISAPATICSYFGWLGRNKVNVHISESTNKFIKSKLDIIHNEYAFSHENQRSIGIAYVKVCSQASAGHLWINSGEITLV